MAHRLLHLSGRTSMATPISTRTLPAPNLPKTFHKEAQLPPLRPAATPERSHSLKCSTTDRCMPSRPMDPHPKNGRSCSIGSCASLRLRQRRQSWRVGRVCPRLLRVCLGMGSRSIWGGRRGVRRHGRTRAVEVRLRADVRRLPEVSSSSTSLKMQRLHRCQWQARAQMQGKDRACIVRTISDRCSAL